MPDIYVALGPMTYSTDEKKAPKQFSAKAIEAVKKAAERTIKGASGFTTDKKGPGFVIRLKVSEVIPSAKGAACRVTGELLRLRDPNKQPEMLSTSLTGGAKAEGMAPERAVAGCLDSIVEDMLKKNVIPTMKSEANK